MITSDYSTHTWNVLFNRHAPGEDEQAMFAIECRTAHQLLDWLNARAEHNRFRLHIQAIPFHYLPDVESTDRLRFALWNAANAAQWIGSRNATSHTSLLWQFALVRLSCYLNTGRWLATAAAETEVGL